MTVNEEYLSYVDYLKFINFSHRLELLKEKYANKKIIFFGMGSFLDAVIDNYDLKANFDIVGISDKRITDEHPHEYKGFNTYKPIALRALNFDVIIDTDILFEDSKKYLKRNHLIKRNVSIDKLVQISFKEKLDNFSQKLKVFCKYLIVGKNIFNAIKYLFICSSTEITAKINYIKNINRIRRSNKPIRAAFICSDSVNTDFIGLYNLLYFDKDFKLFPIIIIPDILVENEQVDEEKMQKCIEHFGSFNFQVIDGVDRQTGELACLHAFKPDLVFYQKPIHIKDDFNPLKMSEEALTFTIEYFIKDADFTAMGSKYFRKQVSHLWKIFVANKEDKNLYAEYTDIQNKDIVKIVNENINTGVIKFLKKCLGKF